MDKDRSDRLNTAIVEALNVLMISLAVFLLIAVGSVLSAYLIPLN